MSRKLDALAPRLKPLVFELLARSVEAGIPVMIIDTLRTPEEHAANLAKGVSWIKVSKHLPQPDCSNGGKAYYNCKLYEHDENHPPACIYKGGCKLKGKSCAI